MKKRPIFMLMAAAVTLLSGCSGKQYLGSATRNDVKKEVIVQKDPFADIAVDKMTVQKESRDGITVEISYLRELEESDYECLGAKHDPLNPQLLFAFRMINQGEVIRYYEPIFAFKGTKNIDLANSDPCGFFNTYGKVNYVLAKPGNTVALSCQANESGKSGIIQSSYNSPQPVTLYPDVPVYGVLIVSQQMLDRAAEREDGVTVSTVRGWATFYEKVASSQKPVSFRFDYTFTRKDWLEDVEYEKYTPYTYKVKIYQKTTDTIILGTIHGDKVEEKVLGSENTDSISDTTSALVRQYLSVNDSMILCTILLPREPVLQKIEFSHVYISIGSFRWG